MSPHGPTFVWKSRQNDDFCVKKSPKWRLLCEKVTKMTTFANFYWAAQNGWKSRKTRFYVFCLFTPLYRRFRLSRVSQTIDLEEIYRLVSKILNFTPCGSVFDRFCVLWENIDENLSKIWWKSNENLLKIYWKSIENLWPLHVIEHKICYRTVPSRASGTPCGSVFGRFCVLS